MNKRRWMAATIAGVLAMGVSGCGQAAAEGQTKASIQNEVQAEPVEITFWDNNADSIRQEIFKSMIEDFEKENPDIKVNYVPLPSDQAKSKFDVAIQSHTAPDCGIIYWISDFVMQEALVALDQYVEEWSGKDDMLELYNDSVRSMAGDGLLYGIPYTCTLPVVWYNKPMFEEAGLKVPENWGDVLKDTEILTDRENGKYGFSLRGGAGSTQQLEQMMYQHSGITQAFDEEGKSTINAPAHVELVEQFAKIYNVNTPESDITNGYQEMISAFESGAAAMVFHNLGSYTQNVDTMGEDFGGVVALNSVENTQVAVDNGCNVLSIFKDSEHPKEAFRFISFLSEYENISYFNKRIGQLPCNKSALKDSWIAEAEPTKQAAQMLLGENTVLITLPTYVAGYYDLHSNVLEKNFQEVLLGNMSAQEFLDDWAGQMTQLKEDYEFYMGE